MKLLLLFTFLWLIPCAWQDWRTGEVSNWLTLPVWVGVLLARLLGWLDASWLGIFLISGLAWVFWQRGVLGGADAKGWMVFVVLGPQVIFWVAIGQILWYVIWKLALQKRARFAREVVMFPGFALGVGVGLCWVIVQHVGTNVP